MTKCAPEWRLLLFLCLCFSFTGCSQFKRSAVEEEKDPHFMEAKQRFKALDYRGAVESYERALQSNPNNSAAHFELGLLWDKQLNDPAAAIYHFQKHLTLRTNSPQAGFVREEINDLKRELARTHAYAVLNRDAQQYIEQLSATNKAYEKRIALLEAELARGPRYITNYVTNFVKLPEFNQHGPRPLTKPTTIVEAPAAARSVEDEAPETEARPRNDAPRVASGPQRGTSGNGATENGTSRSGRGTAPRSSQTSQDRPNRVRETTSSRTRSHKVRPGETMQVLAKRYNISVTELRAANPGMGNGTRAGQVLNIPQK